MGKVVIKCPACNYYYDGGMYTTCPYCKSDTRDTVVTIKETPVEYSGKEDKNCAVEEKPEQRKGGFWGRFAKKHLESAGDSRNKEVPADHNLLSEPVDQERMEVVTAEDSVTSFSEEDNLEEFDCGKTQPLVFSNVQNRAEEAEVAQDTTEKKDETISEILTVGRFIATPEQEKMDEEQETTIENITNKNTVPLMESIRNSGVTQGRFILNFTNSLAEPVVGWLVCIKGQEIGKSFQLKKGRNKIGRSIEMDVKLLNESSVSRTCQAIVVYDSRAREFCILPGESDSLCYLNDKALYERVGLMDRDVIEFGDSGKNKYMFVEFCNTSFDWSMTEE